MLQGWNNRKMLSMLVIYNLKIWDVQIRARALLYWINGQKTKFPNVQMYWGVLKKSFWLLRIYVHCTCSKAMDTIVWYHLDMPPDRNDYSKTAQRTISTPISWSVVYQGIIILWAATWQNQQNECVPSEDSDGFYIEAAFAQSDQSLCCPHEETLGP